MNGAMRFGLSQVTLDKLNSVFARYPAVKQVLIYGSRAKGNFRHGSDMDMSIKGETLSFDEFLKLKNQIDDLMLPYSVDLSQYPLLDNAELIAHIDRVGQVFYSRLTAQARGLAQAEWGMRVRSETIARHRRARRATRAHKN